jgi:hypothetical protein
VRTISDAIELLGCAEINCDNVKRLGVGFADFVKTQIQEAVAILEAIEEERDGSNS